LTNPSLPPFVAFDGLHKTFPGGVHALQNVSFEVGAGEFCVVLGPSGSGKSTLLRSVNGLVSLDRGSIRVGDEHLSARSLARVRRKIAMIYQQFNLVGRASAAHNVIAGAIATTSTLRVMLGLFDRHSEDKACELLASVGLGPEHLQRRVSELSGGQQQRVGIARAFMADPQLILADEPVASLDPRSSDDILALLHRQARERNTTVLCSLHQLELARKFADRVVAMRGGKLVFSGHPSELTARVVDEVYNTTNAATVDAVGPSSMAARVVNG
jgi:phosphonate transport system ATP-binding protein